MRMGTNCGLHIQSRYKQTADNERINHTNCCVNLSFLNQHNFDSLLTRSELCVELPKQVFIPNSKSCVHFLRQSITILYYLWSQSLRWGSSRNESIFTAVSVSTCFAGHYCNKVTRTEIAFEGWLMTNTWTNHAFLPAFISKHEYDVRARAVLSGKLDLHYHCNVIICGARKPAKHEIRSHKDCVNSIWLEIWISKSLTLCLCDMIHALYCV